MKLEDKHFRLLNLLTMLDTASMLKTGKLSLDDIAMLEAIERVKLECRLDKLTS